MGTLTHILEGTDLVVCGRGNETEAKEGVMSFCS